MKNIRKEPLTKVKDSNLDTVIKMCEYGMRPEDIEDECGIDWMQRELCAQEKEKVDSAIEWHKENNITWEISMGELALSELNEDKSLMLYALIECWGAAVNKYSLQYETHTCEICDEHFGGCPSEHCRCIHTDNEDFLDYLNSLKKDKNYYRFINEYNGGETLDGKGLSEIFKWAD